MRARSVVVVVVVVAFGTSCGGTTAATPPSVANQASSVTSTICPAVLEPMTFVRHAVIAACAPPQLDDARLGCAGACPTPCRQQRTTDEHVEPSYTLFTYDANGRWLSSKYDHNHGSDACTYDGSRLVSCRDGAMTFGYNADGRLESIHVPDDDHTPDTPVMEAAYKDGRLFRVLSPGIGAELTYDRQGRLIKELLEAPAGVFTLTYEYDAGGRLVRRRSSPKPGTKVDLGATYEYDAAGLLAKRVEPWNSGTATATYRYDVRGRVTHAELHFILPATAADREELHSWTKLEYEYDDACKRAPEGY
jgi:YD repeat-containing protein